MILITANHTSPSILDNAINVSPDNLKSEKLYCIQSDCNYRCFDNPIFTAFRPQRRQLDREHSSSWCCCCCWGNAFDVLCCILSLRAGKNTQSNDNIGRQYDLKTFFPCFQYIRTFGQQTLGRLFLDILKKKLKPKKFKQIIQNSIICQLKLFFSQKVLNLVASFGNFLPRFKFFK